MQQGQRAQGSISDSARGNAIAISQRRSTSGQQRTFGDSTPARPISQHIPQLAQCAHRRRQRPLDSETQRTEDATSCRSLSGEGGCGIVWVRCLVATTLQDKKPCRIRWALRSNNNGGGMEGVTTADWLGGSRAGATPADSGVVVVVVAMLR